MASEMGWLVFVFSSIKTKNARFIPNVVNPVSLRFVFTGGFVGGAGVITGTGFRLKGFRSTMLWYERSLDPAFSMEARTLTISARAPINIAPPFLVQFISQSVLHNLP